jgi:hypothetical protein
MRTIAPRPDLGIGLSGLAMRLFDDVYMSRPSILLLLVFWPLAFFSMIMAQISRIFTVGSIRSNISHAVSVDPELMNPILSLSGCEIARRIRLPRSDPQKLCSVEVVELFIKQIRVTNLYLLAVVATRFDLAREEARKADDAVENGTVPKDSSALWGVPIVVKVLYMSNNYLCADLNLCHAVM